MGEKPPICVAVLMGGQSHEHTISLKTGQAVIQALDPHRFQALPATIHLDGTWEFKGAENGIESTTFPASDGMAALAAQGVDVAFIALHGPFGEDGRIQGALDTAGIPYTGSGVTASALAMNKSYAKSILREAGIPVSPERVLARAHWPSSSETEKRAKHEQDLVGALGLPLFVKPVQAGSSVGASPVDEIEGLLSAIDAALEVDSMAMVEPLLTGREMTVAVLEEPGSGRLNALPVIEIEPIGHRFFDFESKYTPGHNREICPAPIDDALAAQLSDLAIRAHQALGCAGVSRSDFIVTDEGPVMMELNSLPGLTEESLVPKSCDAAGISFSGLIAQLLEVALQGETR
jgi:D-alanine-D-alanine ligase